MRQRGPAVVLALLVAASCGGDSSNPLATTSTAPASTTIVGTTLAPTTTTLPPTTTTTLDPFLIDIFSIEPTPPSEAPTGVNALLGGAPDDVATLLLQSDLEDDGFDLTGVTIFVWPISGTGKSLVVIEFGESASTYAGEDDQGAVLVEAVLAHPVIDLQNITRLVLRIAGTDEEGPYVFTMTAPVEDMRQSLATGEPLGEGEAQFELERVEP